MDTMLFLLFIYALDEYLRYKQCYYINFDIDIVDTILLVVSSC